jgi:hypothetical protein
VASIVPPADEEDARAEAARAHPQNLFLHVPARPAGVGAGQLRGDVRIHGKADPRPRGAPEGSELLPPGSRLFGAPPAECRGPYPSALTTATGSYSDGFR